MAINVKEVKVGDYYSRVSYGKVLDKNENGVLVENEDGVKWGIETAIAEQELYSSDQFTSVEKITRTELTEKVKSNPRLIMRVCFHKQPEHKEVVARVTGIARNFTNLKPKELSKAVRELSEGPERIMVGRHHGEFDQFGRLIFTDMEAKDGHMRTVDPRTVKWCIVAGTKWELK